MISLGWINDDMHIHHSKDSTWLLGPDNDYPQGVWWIDSERGASMGHEEDSFAARFSDGRTRQEAIDNACKRLNEEMR